MKVGETSAVSYSGGSEDNKVLTCRKGSLKVTIQPSQQPKTLTHLPKRAPLDLAFTDLSYRVQEGRKKSEYQTTFNLLLYC